MFKRLKGRELWWGEESAQLGGGLDWTELAVEHSWVTIKAGSGSTIQKMHSA